MPIRFPAATLRLTLALLAALGLTACIPLPISHMEQVTPRVVGTIQGDDGLPLGALRVATAENPDAKSCQWSAGAALTDAAGRFAVPAVRVRKKVFWLSMMENFGRAGYWICAAPAGPTDGASTPVLASVVGRIAGDSISCLQWHADGIPQLTCDSDNDRHVISGGEWSDGSTHGTYRLIVTTTDATPYPEYRVFVQWLEFSASERRHPVRATVELPAPAIDLIPFPALEIRDNGWNVVVKSNRPGMKGADRFMTFHVGKPGEIAFRPNA